MVRVEKARRARFASHIRLVKHPRRNAKYVRKETWEVAKELNENERMLQTVLTQFRDMVKQINYWGHSGYTYHGIEDFVLQNGVWYTPGPIPKDIEQGAPKCCFGNAIFLAATKSWKYIEGYCLMPGIPVPIHHGWNADDKGRIVDNTLMNTGLAYLGVEFSLARADYATWHDDATILDNPANRNILYRDPWVGEDYSLKWEESPALKAVRLIKAAQKAGIKVTIEGKEARRI